MVVQVVELLQIEVQEVAVEQVLQAQLHLIQQLQVVEVMV
jgi:hypothetical protein